MQKIVLTHQKDRDNRSSLVSTVGTAVVVRSRVAPIDGPAEASVVA